MALTTIAVASLVVSAGSAYASYKTGSKMAALGRRQANRNDYYDALLRDSLANPGKVLEDPGFKEASRQGAQAVERAGTLKGFTGSGNAAIALQKFGQSFAADYLQRQQSLFASMAGGSFNPAQAYGAAAQTQNQAFDNLGNTLASLGYSFGNAGGGGASGGNTFGDSTSVPGTMDAGAGGYIFNVPGYAGGSYSSGGGYTSPGD